MCLKKHAIQVLLLCHSRNWDFLKIGVIQLGVNQVHVAQGVPVLSGDFIQDILNIGDVIIGIIQCLKKKTNEHFGP